MTNIVVLSMLWQAALPYGKLNHKVVSLELNPVYSQTLCGKIVRTGSLVKNRDLPVCQKCKRNQEMNDE
jgi:hypothetical protein